MNRLQHLIMPLLLATAVCTLSGCFHRQLHRFQTHEEKPVVLIETLETTDYWLWKKHEHVFWSCAENDTTLNCSRRCGGDSDLTCPTFEIFSSAVGTNTR